MNSQRIVCIVQARMGSSRLPGKILLEIAPELTLLGLVYKRLLNSRFVNSIVVATSDTALDDPVVEFCQQQGVEFFRGSEENVLDRFYQASIQFRANIIVRVCADRPFVSAELIDFAIGELQSKRYDYISNFHEQRTWPVGLDTEVLTFSALQKAFVQATNSFDSEHVTPFIYNNPRKFVIGSFNNKTDDSDIRLTIDEKDDLRMVQKFLELFPAAQQFEWEQIISLLKLHPDILAINSMVMQR